MCPECDQFCEYRPLVNSCFLSKITYLFDNASTVLFAIFMTGWGKLLTISQKKKKKIKNFFSHNVSGNVEKTSSNIEMGMGLI